MRKSSVVHDKCLGAFKVIGDFWSLTIIDALRYRETRFCELERTLDINPVTLTNRLKRLEKLKIIERREEAQDKLSVSYRLRPLGYQVLPILDQIESFAQKFKA